MVSPLAIAPLVPMPVSGQRGEMLSANPFFGKRCQHPLEPMAHSGSPGGSQILLLQRQIIDQ